MIYYNIYYMYYFFPPSPSDPTMQENYSEWRIWGLNSGSLAVIIYDYQLKTFEFCLNNIHNLAKVIQNLIGRFYGNLIPLILAAHAFWSLIK